MGRWTPLHHDLGLQLLVLYLLLIVPFLGALVAFDRVVGVRIRADVQANDLSLARAIAQETNLSVATAMHTVEELAAYPSVVNAEHNGMAELFRVVLNTRPDVNLVYRLDASGIMLYHAPTGPGSTVGTDFSFREYFQAATGSQRALVSEGRISPTTNQAVATAVMPIWRGGRFLGVVATNIRLESLSETLAAIISEAQAEEGFQVVILDSGAQIIAAPDSALLLQPATDFLPAIFTDSPGAEVGSNIVDDRHGQERLYTHAPIPNAGWTVIVSRPVSVAFASQITLHRLTLGSMFVFIVIGLVFWLTLNRRVITPIERLAPVSEAIGMNQNIGADDRLRLQILARRRDQIGHLIQSIFRMEGAIQERMREQSILLETSTAVVSSLDPQTVLNQILEQVERLLHVQMIAVIARDEQRGVFRIRASRGLSKRFTEQLSIQPHEASFVAMRALHSREPIQVSDTETDPSYVPQRPRARAEGFRALLGVPLNTQHAPPTVLIVFHRQPHQFTENEIKLLVSFANQATMAIENAVLYSRSDMRLQEQTRRLEALVQSLSDGLILNDPNGKVIYANRRIEELAGLSPEQIVGAPVDVVLQQILRPSMPPGEATSDVTRALSGDGAGKFEIALSLSGRPIHMRFESFQVTDAHGVSIGRGIFLLDITAESELDRMKSSLISTVSHELRTPLAAIKGYASTLLAEDVEWDRESQREFLSVISDESDRLSSMVNNLLDLSRLEAGSLRLTQEECKIESLIHRAAYEARLQPANKMEIALEPELPPLHADPLRLETVLRNLIENAVKYAGAQASIKVSVRLERQNFVFRVADDGPGIPTAELQRIFESFYRVDDRLTRVATGAGLGLAICKGFVRAHGGSIWVEPQADGTCFAFSIPLQNPDPAARLRGSEKAGSR